MTHQLIASLVVDPYLNGAALCLCQFLIEWYLDFKLQVRKLVIDLRDVLLRALSGHQRRWAPFVLLLGFHVFDHVSDLITLLDESLSFGFEVSLLLRLLDGLCTLNALLGVCMDLV